ncbi:hypothetical protein ACA910_001080 [Epithemia clementina (nom. ined.)]
MISGLKRSMPCEDLLSLSPTTEKALLEADKFLDDSVRSLLSKRRRLMSDGRKGRSDSPATAALEASLSIDYEYEYDSDSLFDPIKMSLLHGGYSNEFGLFPTERKPTFSCTNPHKNISLSSVHAVNEMTVALSYLSTASKA